MRVAASARRTTYIGRVRIVEVMEFLLLSGAVLVALVIGILLVAVLGARKAKRARG